jgi:hypothetical protein
LLVERLVEGKGISKHLGAEALGKVRQPIEFKWIYPGAKQNAVTIKGYDADLLIDVCNAILAAKNVEAIYRESKGKGNPETPFFYGGRSVGGSTIRELAAHSPGPSALAFRLSAGAPSPNPYRIQG